jgi:tetratricopeptide (TPR) repeat protein
VAELVGTLPEGATTLVLQGHSHGAGVPYWPLREPLRRLLGIEAEDRRAVGHRLLALVQQLDPGLVPLVPLLAPVVDAEVRETPESEAVAAEFVRQRVASLVAELLALACPGPLLLVAEDAHWFDDTTSGICARLAEATATQRWLLCATRRPDDGGFEPVSPETRIVLSPLLEDIARDLVVAATEGVPLRPHERDAVIARAGGNPLFLEELVRVVRDTGVECLPDSLDAVAMREIDALAFTPRRVIRLAAVLGRTFERQLLLRLLADQGIEAGLDPCTGLERQLVPEGDGQLRFRHAVLHEAAYQSLPFKTRLGLHRSVAETLEHLGKAPEEVAPLLSFHSLAAQDWERTWRYARLAAGVTRTAHAPCETATHLERAVAASKHLDEVEDHELASVLSDLGWTFELLGEYGRADEAYRRAGLVSKLDPLPRARVADRRAYIRSEYQGRPSAAIRQIHAALSQLAATGTSQPEIDTIRANLLAHEADVRLRQGRLTEALRCSQQAVEEAERVANRRALALGLYVLDGCLMRTGRTEEATHMERVLELYEELGDHVFTAITLNNLGGSAFFASRWDEAADYFSRASQASTAAGDLASAAIADLNLGEILVNQGHLQEAASLLVAARRTLESFDYRVAAAAAAMQLARTQAFQGDLDAAVATERSAIAVLDEAGAIIESAQARAHLAEIQIFGGQRGEAQEALADARELERSVGETPITALIDRVELTLAARSGDREFVERRIHDVVRRARRLGALYDMLVVLALAEELGLGEGDTDAAAIRRDLGVVRLAMLGDP